MKRTTKHSRQGLYKVFKEYCDNNNTSELTVREIVNNVKEANPHLKELQDVPFQNLTAVVYYYKLPYKSNSTTTRGKYKKLKCSQAEVKLLKNLTQNKYIKDSYKEVQKLLPDVFTRQDYLEKVLKQNNIPYISTMDIMKSFIQDTGIHTMDTNKAYLEYDKYCKQHNYSTIYKSPFPKLYKSLLKGDKEQEVNIEPKEKEEKQSQVVEKENLDVYEEVNKTLERKYKLLNCNTGKTYTTQDFLNMLNMLLYLSKNSSTDINKTINQHNIMNSYQNDILHEIENTDKEEHKDKYLMDKLRLLRNIRRLKVYETENLKIINTLFENINRTKLKNVYTKLQKLSNQRNNSIFIPQVDIKMVQKYDWAKYGNVASAKNRRPITNTNTTYKSDSLVHYEVSCTISGGGYGVFGKWRNTYWSKDEETARISAIKDLEDIKKSNKGGVLYSDIVVSECREEGVV